MTQAHCPNCDAEPTPIVYGLPAEELMEEALSGDVALGGCVVSGNDPNAACHRCHAVLWGHGVFAIDANLRARLGVPSHRLEASLGDDGTLWMSGEDGVATMPPEDADLVMLRAVVTVFDDAEQMKRWCARRRIPAWGRAQGMLGHVVIDSPEWIRVLAEVGELRVGTTEGRLLLHLLRDMVRELGMRTVDEVADYFEGFGGKVTRSAMPLG